MGYREISLKLPTDYGEAQLRKVIARELGLTDFSYQVESKSLDARQRRNIHWLVRVGVASAGLSGGEPPVPVFLDVPCRKRKEKVLVVGSGPAGFFTAFTLQKAGVETTLIERGSEVQKRTEGIERFESGGPFDSHANYAFGEGGAGTFSDGKLTSRTKSISKERQMVLTSYVHAGAPEEILYMTHPHLGSDNLKRIVMRLREEFTDAGGRILFDTCLDDLTVEHGKVVSAATTGGVMEGDYVVIAPGHSAHDTYRMLMRRGVSFRTKPFAIGCRVEHPQHLINKAQWGVERLPGVKAAEYRLTSKGDGRLSVYTFCMCPGGVIVPATAYERGNIVNGMSRYQREGMFANAACVAAINLGDLLKKEVNPLEALEWLGGLEEGFYDYSKGYRAPFCTIEGFMKRRTPEGGTPSSSYPLGLKAAPLWELLPDEVSEALREGLKDFSRKIKGFETGLIMGLESKTSSPVQVLREKGGACIGFDNLYIVGEGSGFAGGIVSSASDGIRTALDIIARIS